MTDLVKISPSFRLHGNYVGPGHTGAIKLGDQNWSAKPVDALDDAARNHDWSYYIDPGNRGAADAVLAKRALAVAEDSRQPLSVRSKALGIALGMGSMSIVGSRNGNKVYDAPSLGQVEGLKKAKEAYRTHQPARPKVGLLKVTKKRNAGVISRSRDFSIEKDVKSLPQVKKPPKTVPKTSQINGNNGSATNTDDVKHNQTAAAKKTKQLKKEVKREISKMTGPSKSKPLASKTVESGLTATTFQETATVTPYYREGFKPNSKCTMFSLGNVNGTGASANSLYLNGGVNQSIPIDKNIFSGQAIGKDFDNHEMARIIWARVQFLPSVGSTTAGSIWIFSDPDATDVLPQNSVVQNAILTSHPGSKKHTLWKDKVVSVLKLNKQWLYTDSALNIQANTTAANAVFNAGDPRLTTFGVVNFINGENIATSVGLLGEWFFECEVQFRAPQYSDISSLVLSSKVQAGASPLFTWASSTNYDPFAMAILMANGNAFGNTNACECVYNPRLVRLIGNSVSITTACQFRLPVGIYQFFVRVFQTNGGSASAYPTTCSFTVNNAVYSSSLAISNTYSQFALDVPPEFTNAPAGSDILTNGSFGFTGRIRVTTVNGGATSLITSNITYTGATFPVGCIHAEVIRLPDFSVVPLAMYFPLGNKNGNVGLDDEIRVSLWNGRRCDDAYHALATMICPRAYARQVQDAMMSRWLVDNIDSKTHNCCIVCIDNDVNAPLPGSFAHYERNPSTYRFKGTLGALDALPSVKELSDEKCCSSQNHDDFPLCEEKSVSEMPVSETPELVENPLTKSIHVPAAVIAKMSAAAQPIMNNWLGSLGGGNLTKK